jgi:hypothetical protein
MISAQRLYSRPMQDTEGSSSANGEESSGGYSGAGAAYMVRITQGEGSTQELLFLPVVLMRDWVETEKGIP